MELYKVPNGNLQIDKARICQRHFSGKADEFHAEGERDFSLIIPNQDIADELLKDGWNVKIKPSKDPDGTPFMFLKVKVEPDRGGIVAWHIAGNAKRRLRTDELHRLDQMQIERVDLDIRPFDWTHGNRSGRSAKLVAIRVYQKIDRFTAEYEAEETPF